MKEIPDFIRDLAIAYVLVQTEPGAADAVAQAASSMMPEPEARVRWAVAVSGAPADVIVGVRARTPKQVDGIVRAIEELEGVTSVQLANLTGYFRGGAKIDRAFNGPP